jgi:hypothetical protein
MSENRGPNFQKDYKGCMTIEEYEKELKTHDWYYNYSDDHSVYCSGSYNDQRLYYTAKDNGWESLWTEYKRKYKD